MGDLMAGPEKSHVTPVSGAHRYESYRSNEAFLCMPITPNPQSYVHIVQI